MKIHFRKIQRILAVWNHTSEFNFKFNDRYAENIKDLVACNEIPRTNAAFRVFLVSTPPKSYLMQFFNSKFR